MENSIKVSQSCYLGTKGCFAGIFLSRQILKRRYGKNMKTEKFPDFKTTYATFEDRYGKFLESEEKDYKFRINRLYQVIEKPLYSVYYTKEYCGFTYTKDCELYEKSTNTFWKHNLSYGEASTKVRTTLEKVRRKKGDSAVVDGVRANVKYFY